MYVLGVKIDEITRIQARAKVAEFLASNTAHTIVTPNPEIVVNAQADERFKTILNRADLSICDGFGLWLAAKGRAQRITGVDFIYDICEVAERENKGVYLLGSGSEEVVKKTVENLQKQFPTLRIVGFDKGPEIQGAGTRSTQILEIVDATKPDIIFVAFGMIKQEKWIAENAQKLPSVKILMGVGGAFDFISGRIPRAPRLMRVFGLEWVYRLWQEPRRFGRIFNATFKFVWLYLKGYALKNKKTKILH